MLNEQFGSIYLHDNIVENLAFILLIEKESNETMLYKFGEKAFCDNHLKKISLFADDHHIISFSFGEYGEETISKKDQSAIVNFIVNHSGNNPLTNQIGSALINQDITLLSETFNKILELENK